MTFVSQDLINSPGLMKQMLAQAALSRSLRATTLRLAEPFFVFTWI